MVTNAAECRPSWDLIWNVSCFSRDFCRGHKFNYYLTSLLGLELWLRISQVMSWRQSNLNTVSNQTAFEWLFRGVCLVKLQGHWLQNSEKESNYDSFTAISTIWFYAHNHPICKEPSWWSFDNYLLFSKLQTLEAHLNRSSLLSSANYVPTISTHNNIHSFAHSFWTIQLYNLQVMCHTR